MVRKRSMLEVANQEYKYMMLNIGIANEFKDNFIMQVQQCVEKYLKSILGRDLQEEDRKHNLVVIARRLEGLYPELRKYEEVLRALKDCYYERMYENSRFMDFREDEFENLLAEFMKLLEYIRDEANKECGRANLFKE